MQRHRHQEFLRFLNAVERDVPAGKLVHVILDNYASHKHPKVLAWLARHPRWTFHFTPDLRLLAECRRGLLLPADPPPPQTRRVPFPGRPPGRHQPLPRRAQSDPNPSSGPPIPSRHRQAAASECVCALASDFPPRIEFPSLDIQFRHHIKQLISQLRLVQKERRPPVAEAILETSRNCEMSPLIWWRNWMSKLGNSIIGGKSEASALTHSHAAAWP